MREEQLLEMIERYLNGEMTAAERNEFEALRSKDASINARLAEHKHFTGLLKQYSERFELERRLNAIHNEIDVHTLKEDLMEHPSVIVQLWRHIVYPVLYRRPNQQRPQVCRAKTRGWQA
jgi:serine protease Do